MGQIREAEGELLELLLGDARLGLARADLLPDAPGFLDRVGRVRAASLRMRDRLRRTVAPRPELVERLREPSASRVALPVFRERRGRPSRTDPGVDDVRPL